MNCQDISTILNDRDFAALSAAERQAAELHCTACPRCAKEWVALAYLAAAPVPPMPGHLRQRLHELARSAASARRPRRAGGRPTLIAGLMLLGAAAAALVGVGFPGGSGGSGSESQVTEAPADAPLPAASGVVPTEQLPLGAPPVDSEPSALQPASDEGAGESSGFTVAVSPLVHAADSASVVAATEAIYRAMLDELRAVPNLVLFELDTPLAMAIGAVGTASFVAASNASSPDTVAREEIASELDAAGNRIVFELEPVFAVQADDGSFFGVEGEQIGPFVGGAIRSRLSADEGVASSVGSSVVDVTVTAGVMESVRIDLPAPGAETPATGEPGYDYVLNVTSAASDDRATGAPRSFLFNVAGAAAGGGGGAVTFSVGADLYESYDPAAMAKQAVAQLQKLLFAPTESTVSTLQAAVLDRTAAIDARLRALSELRMIALRSGTDGRVSELVPAVIDMAVNAANPGQKAWLWELIRGSNDRRLVAPLVDSLLYDADEGVRLEAAKTLVTFPDDPSAVAALEQAGRFDASGDVGMFASFASMTEAGHRAYVATALLDSSLPDADRIAPLSFVARYPYGVGAAQLVRGMDAEVASALVGIVRRTENAGLRAELTQHLSGAEHREVIDFLIERLSTDSSELVRSIAVRSLLGRIDRPHVRAALESASANDASPLVRDLATAALERQQ